MGTRIGATKSLAEPLGIVHVDVWTNQLGHHSWAVYRGRGGWTNVISAGTMTGPHVTGSHRAK